LCNNTADSGAEVAAEQAAGRDSAFFSRQSSCRIHNNTHCESTLITDCIAAAYSNDSMSAINRHTGTVENYHNAAIQRQTDCFE